MDIEAINSFFGDIDLFLLDYLLKGKVPKQAVVLDVGCGEGRHAIYFINRRMSYLGIDTDLSKLSLANYLNGHVPDSKAQFVAEDMDHFRSEIRYDFIICSRVLHFSDDQASLLSRVRKLHSMLADDGVLYLAIDSVMDNLLAVPMADGRFQFKDGKIRQALTPELYDQILKFFEEVEPLRTLIQHEVRAQSFAFLRRSHTQP